MAGFIPFAVWPPATVIRVPEYSMADSPLNMQRWNDRQPTEYSKMEWQTARLNIQRWNGRQRPWIFNEYEAKQTTSILTDYLHRLI